MKLTKEYVLQTLSLLEQGNFHAYLDQYVDKNVKWVITGSSTLSGTYFSRTEFQSRAIERLNASLSGSIKMNINHLYIDGHTAIIEMTSIAQTVEGQPYHNEYAWIQTFKNGKVCECRVYYDDVLVNKSIRDINISDQ